MFQTHVSFNTFDINTFTRQSREKGSWTVWATRLIDPSQSFILSIRLSSAEGPLSGCFQHSMSFVATKLYCRLVCNADSSIEGIVSLGFFWAVGLKGCLLVAFPEVHDFSVQKRVSILYLLILWCCCGYSAIDSVCFIKPGIVPMRYINIRNNCTWEFIVFDLKGNFPWMPRRTF